MSNKITNEIIEPDVFPRSLLSEGPDARYKYFQEYSVAHPVLEESFQKLMQTIFVPSGKQLIFVIGPPGAGKTFLLKWIEDEVKADWSNRQHLDRGRIPIAGIEVPSKDRLRPAFGDIYLRLLRALEEPLIDKKLIYGDVTLHQTFNNQASIDPKTTTPKLRYALEQCCLYRRPFILTLDEAHHLMNIAGLSFEELMDWLKSLANMCKVLFGLFGTYEMFDLLDLSDQLTRRTKIVHLRRYASSETDFTQFQQTILSFQLNLPFKETPDLISYSDYLYERTAGCVGNLYNWLLSALHIALLDSKSITLKHKHLQNCVPLTALQAFKMNSSIEEDEKAFLEKIGEDDSDEKSNKKPSYSFLRLNSPSVSPKSDNSKTKNSKKQKIPVGRRLPKRDQTGIKRK